MRNLYLKTPYGECRILQVERPGQSMLIEAALTRAVCSGDAVIHLDPLSDEAMIQAVVVQAAAAERSDLCLFLDIATGDSAVSYDLTGKEDRIKMIIARPDRETKDLQELSACHKRPAAEPEAQS